jgi:hypothetical protein
MTSYRIRVLPAPLLRPPAFPFTSLIAASAELVDYKNTIVQSFNRLLGGRLLELVRQQRLVALRARPLDHIRLLTLLEEQRVALRLALHDLELLQRVGQQALERRDRERRTRHVRSDGQMVQTGKHEDDGPEIGVPCRDTVPLPRSFSRERYPPASAEAEENKGSRSEQRENV